MIRTQVQITKDQANFLKELSYKRGLSSAELIRQGIEYLRQSTLEPSMDEKRRRALAFVGKYASGLTDLSEAHDRYLEEIYGDFGE